MPAMPIIPVVEPAREVRDVHRRNEKSVRHATVKRRPPRSMSAPAFVRPAREEPFPPVFRLPESMEVRRHIADSGPATTLLDVAIGIVNRMQGLSGSDAEELLFLQECVKAGANKTAVPCCLLPGWHGTDEIKDYLLSICPGCPNTPSSVISRNSSRKPSVVKRVPSAPLHEDFDTKASCPMPAIEWGSLELEKLMEASFGTWRFDTFELSKLTNQKPLEFVGWSALRSSRCAGELGIDMGKARQFLTLAEGAYADEKTVPYHNNLHGADVTQLTHALLSSIGFCKFFDDLGSFALILSAVVHDMGHDGRNNAFHVNSRDSLALMYNDRSVLESHHISLAFRIMAGNPDADMLSSLSREQFLQVRKEMITAVLGTDMAHHFEKLSNAKGYAEVLGQDPEEWAADPAALLELQSLVLHAADIANPTKPAALAELCLDMLTKECFMQGDEERRLGMPVSPLCDRHTCRFASSQVGFISFIVQPTFTLLKEVMDEVETDIMPYLVENAAVWEARRKAEDGIPAKEEPRTPCTPTTLVKEPCQRRVGPGGWLASCLSGCV